MSRNGEAAQAFKRAIELEFEIVMKTCWRSDTGDRLHHRAEPPEIKSAPPAKRKSHPQSHTKRH
jgi:hypothetical protein